MSLFLIYSFLNVSDQFSFISCYYVFPSSLVFFSSFAITPHFLEISCVPMCPSITTYPLHPCFSSSAIEWDPTQERIALCTGNNKLYFWSVAGCVTVEVPTESEGWCCVPIFNQILVSVITVTTLIKWP